MPAPKRKQRQPSASKNVGKKRKKAADTEAGIETDQFFMDSDPEAQGEADEDIENTETAEEKRLRLGKAYLKQLRAQGAVIGDDGLEDATEDLDDDVISKRLKQQAQEAGGFLQRQIAARITVPSADEATPSGEQNAPSRFVRCHREAVTSIALSEDGSTVYSVGKEGTILATDIMTGKRTVISNASKVAKDGEAASGPEWVKRGPRTAKTKALLACAVSSDGKILAVGGGDRGVHIWDLSSHTHTQRFPGHKDTVTGLAFRYGTHELYSASFDRSIKLWSTDDKAYVDTLFGHQAEVLSVDALRQERVLSSGHDHTCRVWKIPEESQLIYRSHATAVDCCRYITGTEWVTGSNEGTLSLWSQLKKKPAFNLKDAHPNRDSQAAVSGSEAGWIQSVAVCRGSDLIASGAADGYIRLWQVHKVNTNRSLSQVAQIPVKGFVNSLAIANSGKLLVAGIGQEPRLGRWANNKAGGCGILIHRLDLADEES